MRKSRATLAVCGDATELGNRAIIRAARALPAVNGAGRSAPQNQLERGEAQ